MSAAPLTGISAQTVPALWAAQNCSVRGKPAAFFDPHDENFHRPFLVRIVNDLSRVVAVMKGRQVGCTEAMLQQCLWLVCNEAGLTITHTFPRGRLAGVFSATRFDEMVRQTGPLVRGIADEPWNVGTKTFRPDGPNAPASFYLVNTASREEQGESVATDVFIADEYDRMDPRVEDAYAHSLDSSRLGLRRYISTPSLPGRGVAAKFDASDQNRWHLKCACCGRWQAPTWDDNVEQRRGPDDLLQRLRFDNTLVVETGTFVRVCRYCKKPLDLRSCSGEWVAAYPQRDIRGYHLSQVICPWRSADRMAREMTAAKSVQSWRNYVLGEPWQGEGGLLDVATWEQVQESLPLVTARPREAAVVSAGIDWGRINWVVVEARERNDAPPYICGVGWFEDTATPMESAQRVVDFLRPFNPEIVVADFGYGADRNPYMAKAFPGKFWSARYEDGGDRRGLTYEPAWRDKDRRVEADRTAALKHLCERVRFKQLRVPVAVEQRSATLKRHCTSLALLHEPDPRREGDERETIGATGPDHLAHATLYATVGMDRASRTSGARLVFLDPFGDSSSAGGVVFPGASLLPGVPR